MTIPRDAGRIEFDRDPDYPGLNGNREGLIRLAGELLFAARSRAGYPGLDVGYLVTSSSSWVGHIRFMEPSQEPVRQHPKWQKFLTHIGCLVVGVTLAICTIVGFFTLLRGMLR